jgi:hypothetical protein
MSAPATKAFSPAPVSTTARTSASRPSSPNARASSATVAVSRAFSFSGRSMVTVATAPARSMRKFELDMNGVLLFQSLPDRHA